MWQGFCYFCSMRMFLILFLSLASLSLIHSQEVESDWKLFRPVGAVKDTVKRQSNGTSIQQRGSFFQFSQQGKQGDVKVSKDSRIDALSTFVGTPQNGNSTVKIKGYRIQASLDRDKNRINQLRAEYLSRFSEQPAYIDFLAPNFRLRIGDFRSKLDAHAYLDKIKAIFPDAVIVMDDIDLPRL